MRFFQQQSSFFQNSNGHVKRGFKVVKGDEQKSIGVEGISNDRNPSVFHILETLRKNQMASKRYYQIHEADILHLLKEGERKRDFHEMINYRNRNNNHNNNNNNNNNNSNSYSNSNNSFSNSNSNSSFMVVQERKPALFEIGKKRKSIGKVKKVERKDQKSPKVNKKKSEKMKLKGEKKMKVKAKAKVKKSEK